MSNYKKLLTAMGTTYFGSWFNLIAIVSVIYSITGSKMAVGMTFIIKFLPKVLFSFISAAILDRVSSKKVIIISEIVSAFSILGIIVSFKMGMVISIVYIFYFILGGSVSVFEATRISIIPKVVENKEEYSTFISKATIIRYSTMLISTGIGGFLLEALGETLLLGIDMLSFVISAVILSTITLKVDNISKVDSESLISCSTFINEIKVGFNEVTSNTAIRKIILIFGINQFIYAIAQSNFSLIVLDKLASSESKLGLAYSIGGVGCVISGFVFRKILARSKNQNKLLYVIIPFNAIFLAMMFISPTLIVFYISVFCHDLFATMFEIYTDSALVSEVKSDVIGKVSSFYMTFGRICYLTSLIIYTFALTKVDYSILGVVLAFTLLSIMYFGRSKKILAETYKNV